MQLEIFFGRQKSENGVKSEGSKFQKKSLPLSRQGELCRSAAADILRMEPCCRTMLPIGGQHLLSMLLGQANGGMVGIESEFFAFWTGAIPFFQFILQPFYTFITYALRPHPESLVEINDRDFNI